MTVPFYCLVVIMFFPFLVKAVVAVAMAKEGRGYDNNNPRDQQARLTGWGRRASAAQNNSFEALPIFASAVFIAHLTQGNPVWSARLSLGFVAARCLYVIFYLADQASARSAVWAVGTLCCLALALISLWA